MKSNAKQATIETQRLSLRRLRLEDVPALARLGTDEVFELVTDIETPFDAGVWVKHKLESKEPVICHVAFLKETETPIGYVQVNINPVVRGINEYDIGYWLGRDYWGSGYATEVLTAALESLAEEESAPGRLWPLFAHVHEGNAPSIRLLERCGFVLQGPAPEADGGEGMLRYRWKRD